MSTGMRYLRDVRPSYRGRSARAQPETRPPSRSGWDLANIHKHARSRSGSAAGWGRSQLVTYPLGPAQMSSLSLHGQDIGG
jgi:hypothetical protein